MKIRFILLLLILANCQRVKINERSYSIKKGEEKEITVLGAVDKKDLSWRSANTMVAEVNEEGLVRGINAGETYVSMLISANEQILDSVKIVVEPSEENAQHDTEDLTAVGSFTRGIEGPAVDDDGNVYAVNFKEQGTIGKVTPNGDASLFVSLPEGSIGNGIRFNSKGEMLIADYPQHNILKVNMDEQTISIYAHEESMNQPNDIAIMDNDILFASDPNWSENTGNLWRINTDGSVDLLEDNMGTTNGIEISPDQTKLYINESVQRKVWVYDLSPEGDISNKRLLTEFPDFGMDGMRTDQEGNLYITRHGKGTVVIVSPSGKILDEIKMQGELPSNIAFGGPDGKTCYVTLQDRGCIETFQAPNPGRAWK
ncbi:gluconolactonase [Catalinimonas alkaloidigena]|uniref:SMP-30/gluconolactonase/LRE family protein n=1 Tax=Catalinimonas alkaloidigena TaxID=1075417 RepID=UPI002405C9F8|nr:SMP-30/gluconolactonase/LRE family protein [Catalinimonas alkaloidigena]MDF9797047.1 gluconolactonase [Catalinimonas alkaloidigena]